ncbi:MAG: InlB B-repeat-containing protein, partial [Firmicutes bacterium]|nr:InlB B-repeat-containing protein [Bacillota bacterium]
MSRKIKVCLALFLSLAVLAQYSFTPQAMVAYGMDNTVEAAQTSDEPETTKSAPEPTKATEPAPEPTKATEAPAPTQAPAATTESTQATESTEATTVPEEQSDDVEDENDVNTGDPIAGEDQAAEGEAAEEEEPAEEDTDEEYPAVSFTKSAGGVTVKISAPKGALPEGAKVKVTAVSAASIMTAVESAVEGDVENVKAVDITFYNKDGKEIKPKKAVSVTMSASGVEADAVVHIADSGAANAVGASTNGSSAVFKTANFSIYAIVETSTVEADEKNNVTINYTAGTGGSVTNSSELVNVAAENAKAVGSTAKADEGYIFTKWTDSKGKTVSTSAEFAPSVSKLDVDPEEADTEVTFTANFEEQVTVTFDPNTEEGGELAPITINVAKGEAIGSQLPTVPEVPGYNTKWVKEGTETEVTADTVVNEAFTAVVSQEKITYTVTFVQEDETTETRTTSIDDGFAINDLPEVEKKTNKIGKWVYPGTTNEFTVGTVISEDLTVNAYYEQNIFTVTFMVDGAQYEEMTTATGTKIVLPSDPIKSGATFKGWFTQEDGQGTQYTADSTVSEDLTLYAYFEDQVRVKFLVKDDEGNIIKEKSQYFIELEAGDAIETLPEDPFISGKVFEGWVKENNPSEAVEVGTVVEDSFNAVAKFSDINFYEFTVHYFYMNGSNRVDIGSQTFNITKSELKDGYTITAPQSTIASEITDEPTYYPVKPTITVDLETTWEQKTLEDGTIKMVYEEDDEYVEADATYKVGHYLKDLDGEDYGTLIEQETKQGVKNSLVTPDINSYPYAKYASRDTDVKIMDDPDQELKVYYDRRDFTLSFEVGEGEYIEAVTKPYGTEITLPTNATRTGYTFDGWYKDAACTESAGSKITLEENTTLHAKWNPALTDYTVVYMIENANDEGYSYLGTATKQAETDTTVKLDGTTADAGAPNALDKQNFTFKESSTETIKADGSSVVVVKYSRNVYTITWNGDVYNTRGERRARNQGSGSVTAKYGANITQQWIAAFNTPYPDYAWSLNTNNNDKVINIDTMPGKGDKYGTSQTTLNFNNNTQPLYAFDFSTTKTQVLNYWLENYTGDGVQTTTRNGKTYGLYKSVTGRFNYLYENSDFYAISGYTKDGYTATYTDRWGRTQNYTLGNGTPDATLNVNFYYAAASHPLTFINYDGTEISTQNVKLNADISGYLESNIPEAPMEGATWLGWFTDAEHENSYTIEEGTTPKMPEGLVLYGNFQFPERTVTFDSQGGSEVPKQTDEYGFYAKAPTAPDKEGYEFQGWFTAADETGSPYDWNKPVTENITLYAHWTQQTLSYTVHYYEWDTENDQATTNQLLADKVVSDPDFELGQTVTETAPAITGHVSDKSSASVELTFNDEENVIIFYYYTIPDELTYTVNYVLKDYPQIKVAESKTVTVPGTTTTVQEIAAEVDKAYMGTQTQDEDILGKSYKPTNTTEELTLALEGNVITFEYVSFTTSKIKVNYLDMDGNEIADSDTTFVEVGDTFTLQNKAPNGYVYHHAYLKGTETAPKSSYLITGSEGDIEINVYYQKKLIIVANNKAKSYDGEPLFSSGLNDATITGNLRGDTVTSIAFDGSQTDAGTSATTPKNAQITKGASAITDPEVYYSIIYVPGNLTVKPVSVYISISADQWNTHSGGYGKNYYTGQVFNVGFTNPDKQHFNDNTSKSAYVSITSGQREMFKEKYGNAIWNALYGENGALISEKNAGTYTYTGAQQKATVMSIVSGDPNYSVTVFARDSFLVIDPLPIKVTTGSDSKAYDGTALTKEDGAKLSYSYWTENIGGDWTSAEAEPGTITLETGDKATFTITGSQTEVGTSDNTYTLDLGANAGNYVISDSIGELEVTAAKLSVTVKNKEATYNGSEQLGFSFPAEVTGTGNTIETDDYIITGLAAGNVLKIDYTPAKGTNVGTYSNGKFAESFTIEADNKDAKGFYSNTTFTPGTLKIKPITDEYEITVTGNSDTKVYNTAEQSVSGYTVSNYDPSITFTGIEQDDAKATAKGTNAGTYTMTMSKDDFSATSDNYTNIKITVVPGTLEITPITQETVINVTGNSATKIYNGTEQSVNGYTIGDCDPTITITKQPEQDAEVATAKGTNKGEYTMALSESDFAATSPNYTNIKFNVTPGVLTISKKTDEYVITVTGNSATKIYNGSEQSVSGYTVSEYDSTITFTGIAQDDAKATAKGTNKGTYKMTMSEADFSATSDNYENIKIVVEPGTLEITPVTDEYEITVTGNSDTKVYNKSEQSVNGYTVSEYDSSITFTGIAQDDAKATAKGTNVGTYTMTMSKDDFSATSDNYTNIKITVVPGTLTITPITDEYEITVTGKNDTKVYNGSEQSVNGYTVSDYDSTITFTGIEQDDAKATAKGTNKGTYKMTMSKDDFSATSDNYTNIKITVVPGTLEITANEEEYEITVTGNSATNVYNTKEQSVSGYTVSEYDPTITFTGIAQDDAKATAKGTNVGTYKMTMSKDDFSATSDNYTNIKITVVPGTLEITPITDEYEIVVTGNSATKVYNKEEQSVNGYTVGEYDPTITFTGIEQDDAKATAKGTNAGTYTMTMNKDDFSATSDNYTNIKITVNPGTLTITKSTDEYVITVTGASAERPYNGQEQNVSGYTVSEYDPSITFTGIEQDDAKATAKGTNAGTYTMTMSKDDFSATSDNYENIKIVVNPGTLKITPSTDEYEIKVTGNSDTQIYNGSEQSVSGYTVSEYDPTITFTGIEQDDAKATAKGTNAGTYTMTMSKDDFSATSDNY